MIRILGVDPGSRATGYGVVDADMNRLTHVAHGVITTRSGEPLAFRLEKIFNGLREVSATHGPVEAGIETIFHANNAQSALKLGHARGVALLALQKDGLAVTEYSALQVKSAVVGYGKAAKEQVQEMVKRLLALQGTLQPDAADALAVAICHAQTRSTLRAVDPTGDVRRVGRSTRGGRYARMKGIRK